ncbi:Tetratricopeptide repeat protein 7B [Blattella germanica]|nr:Tetratricopeptide repeat protein 7B [Blattella germanica]
MAGKSRNYRIESEIEKSREESNWKKVIDLAEQLKLRSPNSEYLATFLIGEGKLESFLEEFPPIDANISKARTGLTEAKRYLLNTASEQGKKAGVMLDSYLLLGKLHYAMGMYEDSLNYYNQAELHSLTEKQLPSRSLRIVAESYAIKGMCLEKVPPSSSSKYKQAEWEEQRIKCFELAGDLTLLYLQEQDKLQQQPTTNTSTGSYSPQPPNPEHQIGPVLETALQRAPILYIQAGKLQCSVTRYRTMLSAVESSATQSLRLTLTRQLAEVLLRGVSGTVYTCPEEKPKETTASNKKLTQIQNSGADSPWKPRKYTGFNLFIPRNENEEIILLLLISEAMAVRDASFERAMKFSFEEPHVWMQHALCLVTMGQYAHALSVLKEVSRLLPTKVIPCLLAARICYEQLNQVNPNDHLAEYYLGLQFAQGCQVTEAMSHVKMALNLRAEHVPSLHLLILLLSAQKQHAEALQLQALFTAKHMLALWKTLYEDQTNIELPDQSEKRSDTRSVFQLYTSEMSDKDSSSLHAHSLAASRVEQALSEVASSLSSFTPRPGPQRAWLLQLQIWLLLAEIYLSLEQITAATACIQEATSIFPLSHHIMYMRGLVHEYKQEFMEAKLCFQNAVAINPTHIKSLQHLGLIYHYLGSQRLAEKTLRDAARIDPASHQTWYNLGKVLESLGEFDTASDCMATALEVEIANPILPFSSIPLTFD